jgi:transcriptional regulator with XRE-family HTH domain
MINSTLGGSIKDLRQQKGISQLDIAFSLGWKEPSRLSRIEQGKTEKPPRELLDKIMKAIGLEEEEKNSLLLTGSYLPTDEEIERIKLEIKPILDQWPYPAVMMDFSWRLLDQNDLFVKVSQMPPEFASTIYKSQLRVLDMLFNFISEDKLNETLLEQGQGTELQTFLRNVILNFKYEQRNRTNEKWYIDHIKKLMDNKEFRNLWVETNTKDSNTNILGKYIIKKFMSPEKDKILSFYMFVVPFLRDPRFDVELFVPLDLETNQYYHQA